MISATGAKCRREKRRMGKPPRDPGRHNVAKTRQAQHAQNVEMDGRREGNGNQQNALEYIPLFNPPEGLMSLCSQPPLWKVYWQKWIKNVIVCGQLDDESPGCKGWQEAHVLIHLYLIMINRLHEIYWLLPGGNSKTLIATLLTHTSKNFSFA